MDCQSIYRAIPHREPFLLVDEILEWSEEQIVLAKTFHRPRRLFQGHYPGHPIVPGVLLCEAAMQAGAILLSRHLAAAEGRVPVATRMNDVRFQTDGPARGGDPHGGSIDRPSCRRLLPQSQGHGGRAGDGSLRLRLHRGRSPSRKRTRGAQQWRAVLTTDYSPDPL